MADLSPAALAIFQAFDVAADNGVRVGSERRGIAAALHAAADGVWHHWDGQECIDYLMALAAELDPAPDAL